MPTPVETPAPTFIPVRRAEPVPPLRRKRPVAPTRPPVLRRALNALLLFITAVLVVDALVGDKGFMETLRARRQARTLTGSLDRLRQENARLRDLNERLRTDPRTIEEIARRELGLMRPGEMLFIIKDAKSSSVAAASPGPIRDGAARR